MTHDTTSVDYNVPCMTHDTTSIGYNVPCVTHSYAFFNKWTIQHINVFSIRTSNPCA